MVGKVWLTRIVKPLRLRQIFNGVILKVNKATMNMFIRQVLGKSRIICIEYLIHETYTVGPHFKEANKFLWSFKLSAPLGGLKKKRNHFIESGFAWNHEDYINALIRSYT
ncbi:hypothetical protein KP509_02G062600 [Ceratopteris richardii]|uniref:Ribosomal protein L30 ferredoxin-like fold domain-containing protein n=1 Tax=Ceratopteris richardii TaxID=49495 RepID=A0A8T2VDN3_CERRI|nr:hypothetical protein KP509_02G062600 [Ceratopteris richardii]